MKKMKESIKERYILKKKDGITLIALVITIVVLLILAGVTIASLTGDNGLLTRANEAKEETNYNSAKEEIQLAFLASYDYDEDQKLEKIEEELKKQDNNVSIYQNGLCIEIVYKNNSYLSYPDGEIIDIVNQSSNNLWKYTESTHSYNGKNFYTRTITSYIGPKTETLIIPNYLDGIRVNTIKPETHEDNTITPFLNETNKDIESVIISEGIEIMDGPCFKDCSSLSGKVTIPNSIISIGPTVFQNTSIDTLLMGNNVEQIEASAFLNCTNLSGTLIIPDSVKNIGQSAFQNTNFNTIIIGNNVKEIGMNAFNGCKVSGNLIIPSSVETIGENAFYCCTGLTGTLFLSNNVKRIDHYAFYNTNFETIQIDQIKDTIYGAPWGSNANIVWLQ